MYQIRDYDHRDGRLTQSNYADVGGPRTEEEDRESSDQLVFDVSPSGYSFYRSKYSPVVRPIKKSTKHVDLLPRYECAVIEPIDDDFCNHHLSHCQFNPSDGQYQSIFSFLKKLSDVPKIEPRMYPELAGLLTMVSKAVYDGLSSEQKTDLELRFQASGHFEFVHSRSIAPSHFPPLNVHDEPDLLAVVAPSRFPAEGGKLHTITHHDIITLVEAKADDSNALPQTAMHAYRHQQARPDKPAFLCMTAKPGYYQFLLSETCGVIPSPRFPWTDLSPLARFLYTLYVPSRTHFFYDDTLRWVRKGETVTWNIISGGQEYTDGRCICNVGDPWGKRSTIYYVADGRSRAIIKESYLRQRRRWDEAQFLNHIHADGDVPGVVRLKLAEDVKVGDAVITCGSEETGDKRTKRRLVLYDVGVEMSKATSINNILKVLYDALEVHRGLVRKRGVLHRDMSIHNILMAPRHRMLNRPVMKGRSPFINDMLQGRRPEHIYTPGVMSIPTCLLIDFDHASRLRLENEEDATNDELTARTGTPKYIARSVCLGNTFISSTSTQGAQMPELSGRALELYQAVRGLDHYERYNEKETTQGTLMHGGLPPGNFEEIISPLKFYHRPEHDVESVFWTMFAVLARAQPASRPEEEFVPAMLRNVWKDFDAHEITSNPTETEDHRDLILGLTRGSWRDMFAPFPALQDVADLLCEVSRHVRSEYALWEWDDEPEPDHLHEAVQRLIFQYLVDHPDDVALDPARKRPVDKPLPNVPFQRRPIPPLPLPAHEDEAGGPAARSSGKPPARMVSSAAQSGNKRNAEPVGSTPDDTEEGAGSYMMNTGRHGAFEVTDAAGGHESQAPRVAAKRRGDDHEESTEGRRKRRKR